MVLVFALSESKNSFEDVLETYEIRSRNILLDNIEKALKGKSTILDEIYSILPIVKENQFKRFILRLLNKKKNDIYYKLSPDEQKHLKELEAEIEERNNIMAEHRSRKQADSISDEHQEGGRANRKSKSTRRRRRKATISRKLNKRNRSSKRRKNSTKRRKLNKRNRSSKR